MIMVEAAVVVTMVVVVVITAEAVVTTAEAVVTLAVVMTAAAAAISNPWVRLRSRRMLDDGVSDIGAFLLCWTGICKGR